MPVMVFPVLYLKLLDIGRLTKRERDAEIVHRERETERETHTQRETQRERKRERQIRSLFNIRKITLGSFWHHF